MRTNLHTNPASATAAGWEFLTGTGGAGTTTTVTGAADGPAVRPDQTLTTYQRHTVTTAATGAFAGPEASRLQSGALGDVRTASMYVRASITLDLEVRVRTLTGAGIVVGETVTPVTLQAGQWTRVGGTVTATGSYASVRVLAAAASADAWTVGAVVEYTGALLEASDTLGAYFDGSTPDVLDDAGAGVLYAWTGIVNLSTSTETEQAAQITAAQTPPGTPRALVRIVRSPSGNDTLTRQDGNGTVTLPLAAGQTQIVDIELALTGTVRYTLTRPDGTYRATLTLTPTTSDAVIGTINASGVPITHDVLLVLDYSGSRGTGTTAEYVIDRPDPIVTISPLRTRSGTFELFFLTYASLRSVVGLYEPGRVVLLRFPEFARLDLRHVATDVTEVPEPPRTTTKRWRLRVTYVEVTGG